MPTLYDFSHDPEIGAKASALSYDLLATTVKAERRYVLDPDDSSARILTAAELDLTPMRWHAHDVVDVPMAIIAGIYGAGVLIRDSTGYGAVPFVLCDYELAPAEPMRVSRGSRLYRTLGELAPNSPALQSGVPLLALGTDPPNPQSGPGDNVSCSGVPGTLGAVVSTADGKDAILTAGHVGGALGARARCGGTRIGRVTWTQDPTSASPGTPCPDVSVITLDTGVPGLPRLSVAGTTITVGGPTVATGNASVTSYTAKGQRTGTILAFSSWVYSPRMAGMWGDVYITSTAISDPGDSGAPVLLQGSDRLIGHIVGGDSKNVSFIQAVDRQLRACGCTLK